MNILAALQAQRQRDTSYIQIDIRVKPNEIQSLSLSLYLNAKTLRSAPNDTRTDRKSFVSSISNRCISHATMYIQNGAIISTAAQVQFDSFHNVLFNINDCDRTAKALVNLRLS